MLGFLNFVLGVFVPGPFYGTKSQSYWWYVWVCCRTAGWFLCILVSETSQLGLLFTCREWWKCGVPIPRCSCPAPLTSLLCTAWPSRTIYVLFQTAQLGGCLSMLTPFPKVYWTKNEPTDWELYEPSFKFGCFVGSICFSCAYLRYLSNNEPTDRWIWSLAYRVFSLLAHSPPVGWLCLLAQSGFCWLILRGAFLAQWGVCWCSLGPRDGVIVTCPF